MPWHVPSYLSRIGLFDRDELLEPTLHSRSLPHPAAILICWHGKEFPEIVRAHISRWGKGG